MATTVKELIKQLQEIENQDQTVVFQYYIAEHFIDPITDDNMEPERFEKIVENEINEDYLWDDVFEEIAKAINEYEDDEE